MKYLKGVFHFLLAVGGGLEIQHVMSPGKLLPLLTTHLSALPLVGLVPQQNGDWLVAAVKLQFKEPVLEFEEGGPVSQIEDQDGAVCPSEVGLGDGAEPLLACSVPESQSHRPTHHLYILYLELHPDGVGLVRDHGPVDVLTEQAGLPDTGVTE